MPLDIEFLHGIIDSIVEEVAVIDEEGLIRFVNRAWVEFGHSNRVDIDEWEGIDYLEVCDRATAMGDSYGRKAAAGIRRVIFGNDKVFLFEYPCDSPTETRWFMLEVVPLRGRENDYFVLTHKNITSRKLLEDKLLSLSTRDDLTGLANRRRLREFIDHAWRRGTRSNCPLSLILLDVDYFKSYNDTYGHPAGDACLKTIAQVLKRFARRSGDLAARYGGEAFALVLENTERDVALQVAEQLRCAVHDQAIVHENSPVAGRVTISAGVTTQCPDKHRSARELLEAADQALYEAKDQGRNRVADTSAE
ncbi:MAG: sensor domain-containing diguanylate cyclase [Xanthomonadales bacterium]|nr:sensor domain-containing diguanylate cyclase [Xanthomonadales bacterium]